jgi:hypothetical protein
MRTFAAQKSTYPDVLEVNVERSGILLDSSELRTTENIFPPKNVISLFEFTLIIITLCSLTHSKQQSP